MVLSFFLLLSPPPPLQFYHTAMHVLEHCWKKAAPSPSKFYEYEQQQYEFEEGTTPGLFKVLEVNTHHNAIVNTWNFPSFYKSHLGRLIFRRSLYIKLWKVYKQSAITSLPNSSTIFKHLRQLVSFTDRVVEDCMEEAVSNEGSSSWIPKILHEWLILEFRCGHGSNAPIWWKLHMNDISSIDPTEFGKY
jgi:hypothetical protein